LQDIYNNFTTDIPETVSAPTAVESHADMNHNNKPKIALQYSEFGSEYTLIIDDSISR
jgi:hypothetical protein